MTSSARLAAAFLTLYSLLFITVTADLTSVLTCGLNYYADDFIYRTSTSNLDALQATFSSPLYMIVTSNTIDPLNPIQPAKRTALDAFTAINSYLYINVSTDAYQPVGFVQGDNSSLGVGETTWGFYDGYGFFMWRDPKAGSGPVHIQGFQWVDMDDYPGITQLYWNQTQFDLAAAKGSASGLDAAAASFGICMGFVGVDITYPA